MSIEKVVNYVMESPANTNRAVLISLLQALVREVQPEEKEKEVGNLETFTNYISSGESVNLKLTSNLTLNQSLLIDKGQTIELNLNGKTLSTQNKQIVVDNSTLIINNPGEVNGSGRPILVKNGGKLIINDGKISSANDSAVDVTLNGEVIFNDGTITAQEVGILATYGAKVTMNGGLVSTRDNFCIGGNGNHGQGGTTITINGGRLDGHIKSAGYVACGIYHPQDGTLNITGGEISAENGCGILMRAGALNMTGGTVIGTGDSELVGKVGDSAVTVGPNGIIYDQSAHYPDNQNLSVSVAGGIVVGVNESVEALADEGHTPAITVNGGTQIPPYGDEVIYYDGGGVEEYDSE